MWEHTLRTGVTEVEIGDDREVTALELCEHVPDDVEELELHLERVAKGPAE